MKKSAWIVAFLFALQTTLLGAALDCGCPQVQGATAEPPAPMPCCAEHPAAAEPDHDCCSVKEQPEEPTVPAPVAQTVAPELTGLAADGIAPEQSNAQRPAVLIVPAPPTAGPCCGDPQAQRAPPTR